MKRIQGAACLVALSLAMVLTSAGPVRAQTPVTLNINVFVPDGSTAIARASGELAAAGVDANVTVTGSSTDQMRGLSDGTYDLAYTAFDNVLAWSGREGAEIVAIAQLDSRTTLPIYARPEIADWSDLLGKPLAVDAVDTAFALVLRRVLLAHNLDLARGDYTLLPLGAPAARLDSMVAGTTFAGILNPPTDRQAEAAGMRFMGDQHDVLPDYPGTVMAVRRDWAVANRDLLSRFLRAWRAAGEFSQAERAQAGVLFGREANLSTATATGLLAADFNHGMINPAGLQSVLDLRDQFGYALPMGTSLSVYIDQSFWNAASAGGK